MPCERYYLVFVRGRNGRLKYVGHTARRPRIRRGRRNARR
jgi:hypothetical protein